MNLLFLFLACFFFHGNHLLAQHERATSFLNDYRTADSLVVDGLQYERFAIDTSQQYPVVIHLLTADLTKIEARQSLALDQLIGQETISDLCKRKGALAGVNGGFSFSNDPWNRFHGDPRDFFVKEGRILSEPYKRRSSFGFQMEGNLQIPLIEQLALKSFLIVEGDTMVIDGINRLREEGETILYTPEWNNTTLTEPGGQEAVLLDSMIQQVSESASLVIPSGGFVLSTTDQKDASLLQSYNGERFLLRQSLRSLRSGQMFPDLNEYSFQTAGPTLVLKGAIKADFESEDIPESFYYDRHPRTSVGYSKDKLTLFIAVIDGRQEGYSMGIALDQLSEFFLRLGAWEAYNLDGGGSSTMVLGTQVINRFSDVKERRRCDGLLLFIKEGFTKRRL
jgi:exopolysaccharide biosynthesis protein